MKASEGGGGGAGGSQVQKIFQMLFGGGGGGPAAPQGGGAPQIAGPGPGLGQSPINQILQQIFGGTTSYQDAVTPRMFGEGGGPSGGPQVITPTDRGGGGGPSWAEHGYDPGYNPYWNYQPGNPWGYVPFGNGYDPQGYPWAIPVAGPPAAIWTDPGWQWGSPKAQ